MNAQNSFSIILFTVAVVMFFNGWWYLKKPPKYRESYKVLAKSKYQVRSGAHWDFSINCEGLLYVKFAAFFVLLALLGILIEIHTALGFVLGITIAAVGVVVIRLKVDKALIEKFGK
ncbi:MAG TPA: hypothetical protein PKL92_02900 [Aquaticitalea sp.]|nr:hypothetical protein [Aquaticitalea sp.]HNU60188.1 hypothetical protein [Aquaticitalea sp.]